MTVFSRTERLFDRIVMGFAWLAGFLMMFSLITVCIDVVLRYFFNRPTGWVLQISEYILLYIPFLAAAYVLREESHIRIDIVLNRLTPKAQGVANLITSVLGFFVLCTLTYYGVTVSIDYIQRGVPTLKYLKIPEFLVIMVIPIGCFLFALQFVRRALACYREIKEPSGAE
jgi:TRAP-type C4-dicarboxylate transport system permease small subunit